MCLVKISRWWILNAKEPPGQDRLLTSVYRLCRTTPQRKPHVQHITWRNHMNTFSASLALYGGNPPVNGGFPSQRQWRWAETNDWENSGDAGDLRRHSPHYDVTIMNKPRVCNPLRLCLYHSSGWIRATIYLQSTGLLHWCLGKRAIHPVQIQLLSRKILVRATAIKPHKTHKANSVRWNKPHNKKQEVTGCRSPASLDRCLFKVGCN